VTSASKGELSRLCRLCGKEMSCGMDGRFRSSALPMKKLQQALVLLSCAKKLE